MNSDSDVPSLSRSDELPPTTLSASESEPATTIGRYTVISELGRGGQGIVYRALHPDLPIELALKVCRYSGEEAHEMLLRREAKVLCELDHPNIARIRDLEVETTSENGSRYILALDYIRGQSLLDRIRAGSVEIEQSVKWLIDVARAVGYAHRRGILHLDLKPQNIAINERNEPIIIDFGLARVRSAWAAPEDRDGTSGTPGFMAPEQAEGRASQIDARSDVYSLGAILYLLITGRCPIPNGPLPVMLEQARAGQFDQQLLESNSAPEELKQICVHALAKSPDARYPTVTAFADALAATLPDPEPDPEPPFPPEKWPLLLAISSVLLLLGLWFSGVFGKPDPVANEPSFLVSHIGRDRAGEEQFEVELFDERQVQVEDGVAFKSDFPSARYCFLIALNPDGEIQLCYPNNALQQQDEPVTELVYPSTNSDWALTDGTGSQGFVLVTSAKPLPSFEEWKENSPLANLVWTSTELNGAWIYTSGQTMPAYFNEESRGSVRPRKKPHLIARVLDQIDRQEGVEVHGVFFEVRNRY